MQNKLYLALFAVLLVSQTMASISTEHESLEEVFGKWVSWKSHHNKRYTSSEEESYRFLTWMENKRDIESSKDEHKRALNKFSDMTREEFRSMLLTVRVPTEQPEASEMFERPNHEAPNSVDWKAKGAVSATPNQGMCGSCWAFAALNTYEPIAFLKTQKKVSYSQQQLVSCSSAYGNAGCGGGWMPNAYKYIVQKGLSTKAQYPYKSGESRDAGKCDTSKESLGKGKNVAVKSSKTVPNSCDALAEAVALNPVSVAVDADRWGDYDGGVFSTCGTSINHAVTIVGYVKGKHWLVQNSWGADWGEDGYIRVKWGNTCGICQHGSFPEV